ncbi:sigma-70 family RNA polymerase sigma factor [Microvirga puerhi]|uniref:RNA polymerase sigma factor n=1 Tax=Microvirga puerhi TaxID=2876078 RepID=A0ABS7VI13_9HYPH|nr:sigma-70 family RNA polymerase sigma factor [Microvirga puerhi]MBZ6074730.1 sigma-70 family RNA polymerase sigma factor [Microvirga puerhi]
MMNGNALNDGRMFSRWTLAAMVMVGPRLRPCTPQWSVVWPTASGGVTGRSDGGTIQQRAEEPVPVSLSPSLTAGQAAAARRFHELMLPHLDAAYNLARYLLRDPVAAEDVAQEAFLRAFRAFEGYRGGDPKAWILAIVRNCCHTWAKASASDPTVSLENVGGDRGDAPSIAPDSGAGLIDPADSPEITTVRHDEIAAMRALIESLPLPFRETLVLRELEELSYQEIAEATGTPIGTVMSRLARARQLLADAWRQRNVGNAEARP